MKFPTAPLVGGRTATFSPCRSYRYTLRIVWQPEAPVAAFIGLNPSTADEHADDPTIRRCRGFAERWGCGGMLMLNLFAFRATDPVDMKNAHNPIGPENTVRHLKAHLQGVDGPIVAAWGGHGSHGGRGGDVLKHLRPPHGQRLMCLVLNVDGSPKHPLYVKGSTVLQPFDREVR